MPDDNGACCPASTVTKPKTTPCVLGWGAYDIGNI